jgi:hypothetical protein
VSVHLPIAPFRFQNYLATFEENGYFGSVRKMRGFGFQLFWTRRHVAIEMCVMTRYGIVCLHLHEINVKTDAQR